MSFTLHGLAVSGGIAIGRVHLLSHATLEVAHLTLPARAVEKELVRFDKALATVRRELDEIKAATELHAVEAAAFIELHEMFLADPELAEIPKQLIRER